MHLKLLRLTFYGLGFILFFTSCRQINKVFKTESPRQEYAKGLQEGPLAGNTVVKEWLAAGDSVVSNPVETEVPIQSKVVYFSDEANAWAWQFSLPEGRTLRVHTAQIDTSHQVFIDIFTIKNGNTELEKSTTDSLISHTLDEDQTLVLRIQPELLVSGSVTLTLTDDPSMEFPVSGGIRADIGSFWDDPRDAGARQHEGVDIFAERGTPVVAAVDGRIRRTGNRGLGGKQVWLRANGKSLYYAHLDSINSGMLQSVQKGDTLGFVGNSGNARTTPTHLHFGIYDRGAINPLPFIDFANNRVEPIAANPSIFNKWGRVSAPEANVRPLPSTQKKPIFSLVRNNPVKITGGTGEWYQVELPDGQRGFIFQSLVEPVDLPLADKTVKTKDYLFRDFAGTKPILTLNTEENLNVYANYENQQLVKYKNHWVWINE